MTTIALSPGIGATEARILTAYGTERYSNVPYFAIGSGNAVAFGALWKGATAVEAIEAALEHGSNAHGVVQSIRFPDFIPTPPKPSLASRLGASLGRMFQPWEPV